MSRAGDPDARAPDAATLAWAERMAGGARCLGTRALAGGQATAVHRLELLRADGSLLGLVLKRFVNAAWLAREPDLAAREADVLRALAATALPVPELAGVDAHGTETDVPTVLMTLVPGQLLAGPTALERHLDTLAGGLTELHAETRTLEAGTPFRSWFDRAALAAPSWAERPDAWARAIERVRARPDPAAETLIHRDYHPGNLLFDAGRLSGVLDWTNAGRGPGGVDVAHCALNLAVLLGADGARRFLAAWERAAGRPHDPWLDLREVLEFLPADDVHPAWTAHGVTLTAERVRHRIEAWLDDALARLG